MVEKLENRRHAFTRLAKTTLASAAAFGLATTLSKNPAAAAEADASKWLDSMRGNPRNLAPYFRALASAVGKGDSGPIDEYRKNNPDYPVDTDPGKFCWSCLGAVLIAIGEWLQQF